MHMGVPPLVSDRVGCQADLVEAGRTGWVFRATDARDLQDQLRAAFDFLADPARAALLRGRVQERIVGYTYAQATAGLVAALSSVRPQS
jgi:glycosyltransferase involved in cell wall biosynthesis